GAVGGSGRATRWPPRRRRSWQRPARRSCASRSRSRRFAGRSSGSSSPPTAFFAAARSSISRLTHGVSKSGARGGKTRSLEEGDVRVSTLAVEHDDRVTLAPLVEQPERTPLPPLEFPQFPDIKCLAPHLHLEWRGKTPPDKGTPAARRGRKATGQAGA